MMWWTKFLPAILFFFTTSLVEAEDCNLPKNLVDEIHSYQTFVDNLIKEATNGNYSGKFFKDLSVFIDKFGSRMTGSKMLENAITYISNQFQQKKFKKSNLKVKSYLEPVNLTVWTRGKESAFILTQNRKKKLKIKGLGNSPSGNVTADLFVVHSFKELEDHAAEVAGKIVLFNTEFTNYSDTVPIRTKGPAEASKRGAVGALVRSITPFSIGTLHVGSTIFGPEDKPIPAAAVTIEDAELLNRLSKSNQSVQVILSMNDTSSKEGQSNNFIADITGKEEPENYVSVSGHIDSWDVGQGAMDNGGGAFLALHTLQFLNALNITPPRRTLRAILWTGEEQGHVGVSSYLEKHKDEIKNWTAAFESDEGLFTPLGFKFTGNNNATCIVKEILSLYKNLNTTTVEQVESAGNDITAFKTFDVPLMVPLMVDSNYFWFHHSDGDSLRIMNSSIMDQHLALVTGTTYIIANLTDPLPKGNNATKS